MDAAAFVKELAVLKAERLSPIVGAGKIAFAGAAPGESTRMLEIALANEISVSELAAAWMPSTREVDVKIAFARQAGDEAGHFELVAGRLTELGLDVSGFRAPAANPLFEYLRCLSTTVERVAAGLFTLESIALGVNENFMALCRDRGDLETARIYDEYIQPDEERHRALGSELLTRYATKVDLQEKARSAVLRVLELATAQRAKAAESIGSACFPGC